MSEPLELGLLHDVEPDEPANRLPVEQEYTIRYQRKQDVDWEKLVGQEAEAAAEMPKRAEPTGQEIPPEVLQRVEADTQDPKAKKILDAALSTLTGQTSEGLQKLIQEGRIGDIGLRLTDPMGNIGERLIREGGKREGLPDELIERLSLTGGLLLGMLTPGMAGKAKKIGTTLKKATAAEDAERLAGRVIFEEGGPSMGAVRLNLERIGASPGAKWGIGQIESAGLDPVTAAARTQEFKWAVARMDAGVSERLAKSRRRVTHGETIKEAEQFTLSDLLASELDEKFAARMTAVRDTRDALVGHTMDLAKKTLQGDAEAARELLPAFTVASELTYRDELMGRIAARGLEIRKVVSDAERAALTPERLSELTQKVARAGGLDPREFAMALIALETPAQKAGLLRAVGHGLRTGMDSIYELWINMLLTNPVTHATNTLSNTLFMLEAIPERAVAGRIGQMAQFFGGRPGVAVGEAAALVEGLRAGQRAAVLLAGKAFKSGQNVFELGKVERVPAIAVTGELAETWWGRGVNYFGISARIPTRLLGAEDAYFKGVNYTMELYAQAHRRAMREGLTGADYLAKKAEIIRNPTAFPEIDAAARQFALVQTFTNELGPVGQAIMRAADAIPMGRVIAPFIRTPTNLAVAAKQRTPGLNMVGTQFWSDVFVTGGAARDLALGKMAAGGLTLSLVAMYAGEGIEGKFGRVQIPGGGPKDPGSRKALLESGWQPYSIRIGETYYQYNRLDPLGVMIGLVADYTEIAGQIPQGEREEFAIALMLAFSKNMLSKTYMQGVSDLIEALEHPDQRVQSILKGFARSTVPAGVRAVERIKDPTLQETRTLLDQIRAGVPGWSETLPPRRNLFGEPVVLEGGLGPDLLSPIRISMKKDDPVIQELVRAKIPISDTPKVVFGTRPPQLRMEPQTAAEGVELTAGERDRLSILVGWGGAAPKLGVMDPAFASLPPIRDALSALMARDDYQRATDGLEGAKALMVKSVIHAYREAAKAQLIVESPGLEEMLMDRLGRRAKALGATEEQITESLGR